MFPIYLMISSKFLYLKEDDIQKYKIKQKHIRNSNPFPGSPQNEKLTDIKLNEILLRKKPVKSQLPTYLCKTTRVCRAAS